METDETFVEKYFRCSRISGLEGWKFRFRLKNFKFVTFCHKNSHLRFLFAYPHLPLGRPTVSNPQPSVDTNSRVLAQTLAEARGRATSVDAAQPLKYQRSATAVEEPPASPTFQPSLPNMIHEAALSCERLASRPACQPRPRLATLY